MDKSDIIACIKGGLHVIGEEQKEDGSFETLSSVLEDFKYARRHRTVFAAANILQRLNAVKAVIPEDLGAEVNKTLSEIIKKSAEFLERERGEQWSWNYWTRDAKERELMPYPDDLDDTFAALLALHGYDEKSIDAGSMAAVVKLLLRTETEPGGPYTTWLMPKTAGEAWHDKDIVVNAAIKRCMETFKVELPNLDTFIEGKIRDGAIASPYYPSPCHVIYFLSRAYRGNETVKLLEVLFDERDEDGLWKNSLESAMAISSLINLGFGESISDAVFDLFCARIKEEGFRPHPFCFDPSRDGEKYYAGSRAITAAFVVEALSHWIAKDNKIESTKSMETQKYKGEKRLRKIKNIALGTVRDLPVELRALAIECINTISDPEIVLVPYRTKDALGENAQDIGKYFLRRLALGNLYGWMAYKIYDDIMDGEGDVKLLPVANFFSRKLTALYSDLEFALGPNKWYEELMNVIDEANAWELSNCRVAVSDKLIIIPENFPDGVMRHFADRSIAHALPAVAISLLGSDENCRIIKDILSFFRYYLAARQLHDDAHDWSDDLSRGRLTTVNIKLLAWWKAEHPEAEFNVENDMMELRRHFWNEEIENVVRDIRLQASRARDALENNLDIADPAPLTTLVNSLEKSADATLRERDDTLKFLEAY